MAIVKIHIKGSYEWMDEKVCLSLDMPFLPNEKSGINLSEEHREYLESMARELPDVRSRYSNWFYNRSYGLKNHSMKRLADFTFEEAYRIDIIEFNTMDNMYHILIGK